MSKIIIFGPSLLSCYSALAQPVTPSVRRAKGIYVEALGSNGSGLSINYDMRFRKARTDGWGFRIGGGTTLSPAYARRYRSVYLPLLLNRVTGNRVALETGFGATLYQTRWRYDVHDLTGLPGVRKESGALLNLNIGLRLQPIRHGVLFRLYWAPYVQPDQHRSLNPFWFGASLGYGFR